MITPEYLEEMSRSIELSGQLQDSILKDIVRRLIKTDFSVTDTAKWQVEKLQQAGMLYDEILEAVSKSTPKLKSEIKRIFAEAEIEVFNYPDEVLEAEGYIPKEFRKLSPQMKAITAAAAAKTFTNVKNLVRTTASASQNTFITACELAHEQIMSGAFSYTQAVANAVKQAAPMSGYVQYPSGAKTTVEAAVRRAVMTGVNQTTAQLQMMRIEEIDSDLVEVSAHYGARPDHAEWQGGVYSRSGKDPDYDSFDICGYGTVEGLCGVNCKHNFYIFFKGISKRNYTDEELEKMKNATVTVDGKEIPLYRAIQNQRSLERGVRKEKMKLVGLAEAQKASGNNAYSSDFDRAAAKLKQKEAKLDKWCKDTGLTYESSRTQVYGFDRSLAQRAVHGSKRELAKYTKYLYNKDGTIYVTDDWTKRKHPHLEKEYKPFAVIETKEVKGTHEQIDRTFYDKDGLMVRQVHTGNHGNSKLHPYGNKGEHLHYYEWNADKTRKSRATRELTDFERKENSDIL